jgi:hypothetical protein
VYIKLAASERESQFLRFRASGAGEE